MGDHVWIQFWRRTFILICNHPPKANSAFHPSGVGKWGPGLAGKAKAGMVHSISRWTRGMQVKLWDPLRTRAIPESLRDVFTTRHYTNPHLLLLTSISSVLGCGSSCLGLSFALNLLPLRLPQPRDKCLDYITACKASTDCRYQLLEILLKAY